MSTSAPADEPDGTEPETETDDVEGDVDDLPRPARVGWRRSGSPHGVMRRGGCPEWT